MTFTVSFHLPLWGCPLKFQSLQNNSVCFSQQGFLREGFPGEAMVKNPPIKAGDLGSVPAWADPLEEEMATPSSTLAWRTAWTEEPGGLQSMASHRVGHEWAHVHTHGQRMGWRGTWQSDSGRVEPTALQVPSPASVSSVAQACLTLCHPTDRSTPGLRVHHQRPERAETHVHRAGDATQPSHPPCRLLLPPCALPSIRVPSPTCTQPSAEQAV